MKQSGILTKIQIKAIKTVLRILELNLFRDPISAGLAIKYLKDFLKKMEETEK